MVSIWSCFGEFTKGTLPKYFFFFYFTCGINCLIILGFSLQYSMAVLVLKQCHELRPDDPLVLLHAVKLCLNNLHQVR